MPAKPYPNAGIGKALQWMRLQSGMHQQEVLSQMTEAGRSISVVWLSQVENGKRQPSATLVHQLLSIYRCKDARLEKLLRERPWDSPPQAETHSPAIAAHAQDVAQIVEGYILLPLGSKRKVRDLIRKLNTS